MRIKNPLGSVEQSIRDREGNIIKEVNPNYYDAASKNGKGIEFVYVKDNRKWTQVNILDTFLIFNL